MGFYICLSLALFAVGIIGVLAKRSVFVFFLSIELMLNAANLMFVAFSKQWGNLTGQVWVFFVLVVAACEAAVGFSILIHLFRDKPVADVDRYNLLKG